MLLDVVGTSGNRNDDKTGKPKWNMCLLCRRAAVRWSVRRGALRILSAAPAGATWAWDRNGRARGTCRPPRQRAPGPPLVRGVSDLL